MAGRSIANRALIASLVVAVFSAGAVSALALRGDGAKADGGITNPVHASVEQLGGSVSAARSGEALTIGSRLVTASTPGATATVVIGARKLLLGTNTSIVRDSDRGFVLERGSLIGNGTGGAPFVIRSDQTLVQPAEDAVWRVDRGFTTRIVSYNGNVEASNDLGASMIINALHQASASGAALPPSTGPLSLTAGDSRERNVAPLLVALDAYLSRIASGLDTDAAHAAAFNEIAKQSLGLSDALAAESISERVLPALIAQASTAHATAAYAAAKELRADGGSWGVVALLSGVTTIDPLQQAVSVLLDLVKIDSTPSPGSSPSTGTSTNEPSTGSPSAAPTAAPTPGSTPSSDPSTGTTATPTPAPSASATVDPMPSEDPNAVDELLTSVIKLLGLDPKKDANGSLVPR